MGFLPQELLMNVNQIISQARKTLETNEVCFPSLTKLQKNIFL